jgi:hypothetical protein
MAVVASTWANGDDEGAKKYSVQSGSPRREEHLVFNQFYPQ